MTKKFKLLASLSALPALCAVPVVVSSCSSITDDTITMNGLTPKQNMILAAATFIGCTSYNNLYNNIPTDHIELLSKLLSTVYSFFQQSGNINELYMLEKSGKDRYLQSVNLSHSTYYGHTHIDLDYKIKTSKTKEVDIETHTSELSGSALEQTKNDEGFSFSGKAVRKENKTTKERNFDNSSTYTFIEKSQGDEDKGFKIVETYCPEGKREQGQPIFTYYDLKDQTKPVFTLIIDLFCFSKATNCVVFEVGDNKYSVYCSGTTIEVTDYTNIQTTIAK